MTLPVRPFRRAAIPAGIALAALSLLGVARADAATWTALESAAHPRVEGAFVVHDGGAFHFNGFRKGLGIQNSIERYDVDAGTWQTVAETTDAPGFPTALTHSGTVVVDGETWLIGGRIGAHPGAVTDRVFVFDLDTYAWRAGPTLPLPFAGGGAALVDRRIHAFGGLDAEGRCDVDTHLVFDLDAPGDGWQDLSGDAPFPSPRNHFATVVLDGLVYAVGGQIGHDDCAALAQQRVQTPLAHVYDPAANAWERLADLPWPQSHAEPSSFAHAGLLWSVGGMVQGDRVLSYDPATDAWTWRQDLGLPSPLLAPGARILGGDRLHVFGGGAPDVTNPRAETWVSDVPGLAPVPLDDGAPAAVQDDEPPADVPTPVDEAPLPDATDVPGDDGEPSDAAIEPSDDEGGASEGGAAAPVTPVVPVDSNGLEDPDDVAESDLPGAPTTASTSAPANVPAEAPADASRDVGANVSGGSGSGGGAAAWLAILLGLPIAARAAAARGSVPGARRR